MSNFKIYKRRDKRKVLNDLLQFGLDEKLDQREVDYNKLSKRDRISKSLIWTDGDSHIVRDKILNCQKFQKK